MEIYFAEIYFAAMLQQQHHCHSLQHEIPGSNSPPSSALCPKFNFTIIQPKVKVKKLSKTFFHILCNHIDHNISDCHECLIWVTQPFNLFYTCLNGPTSLDVCVSSKSRSTKAKIMFLHNRLARIMHPQNHHARLPTVQEQVVLSCAPIQECCTNLPMYNFIRLGA